MSPVPSDHRSVRDPLPTTERVPVDLERRTLLAVVRLPVLVSIRASATETQANALSFDIQVE
ncbi:hypothetical protein FRB95_001459 [Tulasnella sp. JGI-2019a]|nr:hypothetical protein FRB95_001459 [Tulasnella sp. JGI-2019a]